MSLDTVVARIAELQSAFSAPAAQPSTTSTAPAPTAFAGALQSATAAQAGSGLAAVPATGSGAGSRMVQIAQGEVGQAEQPPGSNNSARIAQYRSATAGAPGPGPWCAYFTSWVARQAGAPVGDQGQGFGSVDSLYAWAQRSGRAFTPSSGRQPQPGDLIVWDEHIGIVEAVRPDGTLQTIEGNSSDRVSRRVHRAGDALGFVHLG
ncbi:MAG: CHAP domain-containing protein [Thermoleophilaceae bacterium]